MYGTCNVGAVASSPIACEVIWDSVLGLDARLGVQHPNHHKSILSFSFLCDEGLAKTIVSFRGSVPRLL